MIDRIIRFSLENKLVVFLLLGVTIGWGLMVAPFDWDLGALPRDPVPVDAIPDIGENQQIVFTNWPGRSPQDVEDQITYPLTVALQGIPDVRTIRSNSFFGFSSIYVIFEEDAEFYWSRSRILEKLASLPKDTLPDGVEATLGPDATALGQVFWYTLEGRDPDGNPAGGWDLEELRTIQDWTVRYALQGADGVSEVASIGGFVREYQVDVDPDLLRHFDVTLAQVAGAVRMSNLDVGARTLEINSTEHVVRAVGFVRSVEDIRRAVVTTRDNVPVLIEHVAEVAQGPGLRRGLLDKEGAEAVGGVVVVRYGSNPMAAIQAVKARISELSRSLPSKTLADGTVSRVTIVPFYDRSGLISETLETLETALTDEILVTIIVVIVMVMHLISSILVSILLPIAVLLTFIAMKLFGVEANIVALSGIAIAIGTMVDMAIVLTENMLRHLDEAPPEEPRIEVIHRAAVEVGGAVVTAVATTVVSFIPVFAMHAAEGKLFHPLAFTKTFALVASIVVALTVIPPMAHILLGAQLPKGRLRDLLDRWARIRKALGWVVLGVALAGVVWLLSDHWRPVGPDAGASRNLLFVVLSVGGLLGFFWVFRFFYARILSWCLDHKVAFLTIPVVLLALAAVIWLGAEELTAGVSGTPLREVEEARKARVKQKEEPTTLDRVEALFPGLKKQFMPPLDEGSYLLMPTTMPHASIGEAQDVLRKQDMAIRAIPEVDMVVGKIGRVESPLDPAPISMIETVITYVPEFRVDEDGERIRQWRDHIHAPEDIWAEIQEAAKIPGTTIAPKLQPIAARIVMLQSGMRAPMGVKVRGPDLETIERVGLRIERFIKEVDGVKAGAVNADRIVGKPYLEIHPDLDALSRYGIHKKTVMEVVESAIGGRAQTMSVEGRERFPIRVRYMRERRDSREELERILVAAPDGTQIPLDQLAKFRYVRGPMAIKSEDTFLTGYVTFDRLSGYGEIDVVEDTKAHLDDQIATFEAAFEVAAAEAKEAGRELSEAERQALPGLDLEGTSIVFAGNYENQIRSEKTLMVMLPLALVIIFIILFLQFRRISTTLMVFSGILVAWSGGFLLLWLYGQSWFLDAEFLGRDLRDLFQVGPIALSVAVWVGFIALFGIATDDGVVLATYLKQGFEGKRFTSAQEIRAATLEAGQRRVRACLMTTATTILALLPILTSTGRGADIMVPMALPSFGGMLIEVLTMLVVPTLYAGWEELRLRFAGRRPA
jgi:copper/silver efflux system protein